MCVLPIKVPMRKSLETYLMILVYIYVCIYIYTSPHEEDATQRPFFKQSLRVLNLEFSLFKRENCQTKTTTHPKLESESWFHTFPKYFLTPNLP